MQPVFQAGTAGGLSLAPGTGNSIAAAGWPPCDIYSIQSRKLRGAALEKDKSQFYGSFGRANDAVPTLLTNDIQTIFVHFPDAEKDDFVRVLTPTEYERFMGLPEGWTLLGHEGQTISDTVRYFALGNSIAVPCASYIMERIKKVLEQPTIYQQ